MIEFGIIRAAAEKYYLKQCNTRKKKPRNVRQARDKYLFISIILSCEKQQGGEQRFSLHVTFFFVTVIQEWGREWTRVGWMCSEWRREEWHWQQHYMNERKKKMTVGSWRIRRWWNWRGPKCRRTTHRNCYQHERQLWQPHGAAAADDVGGYRLGSLLAEYQ